MSKQLVMAITGGGTEAIGALLRYGGASSYFLEGIVPYSSMALARFLDTEPKKFVSEHTARMMANRAYERAEELSTSPISELVGIGVTASLKKANERPGREHVCYISARTYDQLSIAKWIFKEYRDREEEERLLAGLIINFVNELVPESYPLAAMEQNEVLIRPSEFEFLRTAKDEYKIGNLGKYETYFGEPIRSRPAILPGSFNPIHDGHKMMVKHMAAKLHKPIYLELGIGNVDKLTLDIIDVNERMEGIKKELHDDSQFREACGGVILSSMPKFHEKLWRYNSPEFIIGTDTAIRLFNSKYGESSFVGPKSDELIDICVMNTSPIFHVMPRPGYTLPAIPQDLQRFFDIVDDFHGTDISSTQIRESSHATST